MHLLELPSRVELAAKEAIEPGEYIVDDVSGAQLLVLAGGGKMTPVDNDCHEATSPTRSPDESVLFMRAGGFGDLVLLTPVLREHKRRFPNARIAVCTMSHYAPCLAGLPYIDEILKYPITTTKLHEFDRWVFFENAIERNPQAQEVHMTDLFGEICGVEMDNADRKPEYRLTASEALWANETYPREDGVRRCAIHVGATAAVRRYPQQRMEQVFNLLLRGGWELLIVGARGELGMKPHPKIKNLTEHDLKFRHSVAAMNTADVLIGPDSCMVHIAGALGLPAVALYGSFPWKLRTAYCPTTYAFQGQGSCAPCFHHSNQARRDHFPAFCPSRDRGLCQVLDSIRPEGVVEKANQIARMR